MIPFLMIAGLLTGCGSQVTTGSKAETTQATKTETTTAVSEQEKESVQSWATGLDLPNREQKNDILIAYFTPAENSGVDQFPLQH